MSNMSIKHLLASSLFVLTTVLSPLAQAEKTLTAAVPVPADSVWGKVFSRYVETVDNVSGGELKIRVIGPESLPAREQINSVRSGIIDILSTFPGAYRSAFPEANVQEISNISLDEQKENGSYDKLKAVINKRFDAEVLSTYALGVPFHIYLNKEIKTQSDLEGIRLRSSELSQALLRKVKAQQIDVPIPEVFTALERKMVDGYAFNILGIDDMGWEGMTHYRVDPGFYSTVFNIMLSNKSKSKMTDQELEYLREAAKVFEENIQIELKEMVSAEYKRQESIGIKSIDLGEAFPEMARQVYWDELTKKSDFAVELKALMNK
ncbi:TRAP transporter substrate-binding protein DctP [Amphritea opalescens]|nr:TRAP transporter substrate-binding protein DctP [Amphritea opalescens]